jgi:hypothetical protein
MDFVARPVLGYLGSAVNSPRKNPEDLFFNGFISSHLKCRIVL